VHISGYRREELLGKPHNLVRHPHMPAEAFADLWATIRAGFPWRGLVKNRTKDGGFYWGDAYVTPITQDGPIVGYISVHNAPDRNDVRAAERLYGMS
jgi:aerotaxis receptor